MSRKFISFIAVATVCNIIFKLILSDDPDSGINPLLDGSFALVGTVIAWRGRSCVVPELRQHGRLLTVYLAGTTIAYGIDFALVLGVGSREFPSSADGVWIVALLPYVAGFVLLAFRAVRSWSMATTTEVLLFVVSITISFGMLMAHPTLSESSQSILKELAALSYPAIDVVALIACASLIAYTGGRVRSINIAVASAAFLTFADCLLSLGQLEERYPALTATASDVLYDLSFVLLGVALSTLTLTELPDSSAAVTPGRQRARVLVLTLVPLLVPLTMLIVYLTEAHSQLQWAVTVGACVATFLLSAARMAMLLRAQEHTTAELNEALVTLHQHGLKLQQSQKMEAVGRLAGGIAHEINTPVQFIGQNLEFIRHQINQQEGVSAREMVNGAIDDSLKGVRQVSHIVAAIRSFGQSADDFVVADVNVLLQNALAVMSSRIKNAAQIQLDLQDLPAVACSPSDLQQAFLNLLINAIDAIEETGRRGTIFISTTVTDSCASIVIADSGTGIESDVASRIFEPMFTTKQIGKGSGVGLAQVWACVVDQHCGSVACASTPNVGTSFTVQLPLDKESRTATRTALSNGMPDANEVVVTS